MRVNAHQYTRQSSIIEQPILEKLTTFHNKLASYDFQECPHCNESFPITNPSSTSGGCTRCKRDKYQPKLYSRENNMDPGNVPDQLQDLTQVEELLIASVVPMMPVYRLPHGQYGYNGHVLNLPQDVSSFASKLPRTVSELDIVLVRKEGESGSHRLQSKTFHSITCITGANNKYYRSIEIDDIALQQLPKDGNLVHSIPSICDAETENSQISNEHSHSHVNEDSIDPYSFLSGTFVPSTQQRLTEEQIVRHSIVERQSHQNNGSPCTLIWPQIGCAPINEFQTEGYMSCAFPTLFPTGAADFAAPRLRPITLGNYFKHLVVYKDGRFAKHPRFRYFALNTQMRWRALQAGRIYVRQHMLDFQLMNLEEQMGKYFQREYNILPLACVVLMLTGLNSGVGSQPW